MTTIGDCLRSTREHQGLTLEQTSELSGISISHLSRLESSERQPSVASLLALSAAFGVPVGTLFGEMQGVTTPLTISEPEEPRRESNGLVIATCSGYSGSSAIDALRVTVPADRPAPVPARHPARNGSTCSAERSDLSTTGRSTSSKPAVLFTSMLNYRIASEPRNRPPRCC